MNWNFYDEFDSSKSDKLLAYMEGLGENEISSQIGSFSKYWAEHHRDIYMEGVDGAPDWSRYEHEIWAMGETLRLLLKKEKKLKGSKRILDAVAAIASDQKYGKGRQAFVLLLGEYGKSEYVSLIGELLHDREIVGHAIKALSKVKICEYVDVVENIYQSESGWIKKEACKYVKKCR